MASTHAPPVGDVAEPQALITLITASKFAIPSTVTTWLVATAWNSYQTAFSVPVVQSPVSLLSVAPVVEPVVVVQVVLEVSKSAPEQTSFAGGGIMVLMLIRYQHFFVKRLVSLFHFLLLRQLL